VKGSATLFDAVDVDHYAMPVFNPTIGIVNDILDHLVEEMQGSSCCEDYYRFEERRLYELMENLHLAVNALFNVCCISQGV
jgi:hypothetical protein